MKGWITIKEISKSNFDTLIERGIIGKAHATSNRSVSGEHSCGFYDIKKYKEGKKMEKGNNKYLKLIYAHVGVSITRNHIYIEDKYINMLK